MRTISRNPGRLHSALQRQACILRRLAGGDVVPVDPIVVGHRRIAFEISSDAGGHRAAAIDLLNSYREVQRRSIPRALARGRSRAPAGSSRGGIMLILRRVLA